MYRPVAATTTRCGLPTYSGDFVVTLDQVPCWRAESSGNGMVFRFPVDHEINSKIYLWRGYPWNLEVDAVVNSTNENLDEAHSSPGLHAVAGPGLAEECATLMHILH
ncbi:hypothetical protein LOK49_LG11G01061 [Camellia lanceoleosa]|uniref:Uncharacterized protein n=1 Tax=Camellia lanceoleosa TaxID=1840588 RepID=A0ACC0G4F2_9ERIC|nr:hypothetical protein LOK49_LG11G01061 [Camellia lanceoleosa]